MMGDMVEGYANEAEKFRGSILHIVPNAHKEKIKTGLDSGVFSASDLREIFEGAEAAQKKRGDVTQAVTSALAQHIGKQVLAGTLVVQKVPAVKGNIHVLG